MLFLILIFAIIIIELQWYINLKKRLNQYFCSTIYYCKSLHIVIWIKLFKEQFLPRTWLFFATHPPLFFLLFQCLPCIFWFFSPNCFYLFPLYFGHFPLLSHYFIYVVMWLPFVCSSRLVFSRRSYMLFTILYGLPLYMICIVLNIIFFLYFASFFMFILSFFLLLFHYVVVARVVCNLSIFHFFYNVLAIILRYWLRTFF